MPTSAKPRKKYRPKTRLVNPIDYVLEGFAPLERAPDNYLLNLKLTNHSAMTELLAGRATRKPARRCIDYGVWPGAIWQCHGEVL